MNILNGQELLTKGNARPLWEYVTVEIDGQKYTLTPEEVILRQFKEDLVKKGYNEKDLDVLLELKGDSCYRERREDDNY